MKKTCNFFAVFVFLLSLISPSNLLGANLLNEEILDSNKTSAEEQYVVSANDIQSLNSRLKAVPSLENYNGWRFVEVTSADDLVPGCRYVIVSKWYYAAVGNNINTYKLKNGNLEYFVPAVGEQEKFIYNYNKNFENTAVFTLGGSEGAWTLNNEKGYISSKAPNALAFSAADNADCKISITINQNKTTELKFNNANASLKYIADPVAGFATFTTGGDDVMLYKMETPTFNPEGGEILFDELPVNITLGFTNSAAKVMYSIDGSQPSIDYKQPIVIPKDDSYFGKTVTVKATATFNTIVSDLAEATYKIVGSLAPPVITPEEGLFTNSVKVSIVSNSPSAKLNYTIYYEDGRSEDNVSNTNSEVFEVTETCMIVAQAIYEKNPKANSEKVVSGKIFVRKVPKNIVFNKVTDLSTLTAGKEYIIVSEDAKTNWAMGEPNEGGAARFGIIVNPKNNGKIEIPVDGNVSIFTLGGSPDAWTMFDGNGYLAVNANNKLARTENPDDAAKMSIAFNTVKTKMEITFKTKGKEVLGLNANIAMFNLFDKYEKNKVIRVNLYEKVAQEFNVPLSIAEVYKFYGDAKLSGSERVSMKYDLVVIHSYTEGTNSRIFVCDKSYYEKVVAEGQYIGDKHNGLVMEISADNLSKVPVRGDVIKQNLAGDLKRGDNGVLKFVPTAGLDFVQMGNTQRVPYPLVGTLSNFNSYSYNNKAIYYVGIDKCYVNPFKDNAGTMHDEAGTSASVKNNLGFSPQLVPTDKEQHRAFEGFKTVDQYLVLRFWGKPTEVEKVDADEYETKIVSGTGEITVSTQVAGNLQIFDFSGSLIFNKDLPEGENSIAVSPGFFIVRFGAKTLKLIVR